VSEVKCSLHLQQTVSVAAVWYYTCCYFQAEMLTGMQLFSVDLAMKTNYICLCRKVHAVCLLVLSLTICTLVLGTWHPSLWMEELGLALTIAPSEVNMSSDTVLLDESSRQVWGVSATITACVYRMYLPSLFLIVVSSMINWMRNWQYIYEASHHLDHQIAVLANFELTQCYVLLNMYIYHLNTVYMHWRGMMCTVVQCYKHVCKIKIKPTCVFLCNLWGKWRVFPTCRMSHNFHHSSPGWLTKLLHIVVFLQPTFKHCSHAFFRTTMFFPNSCQSFTIQSKPYAYSIPTSSNWIDLPQYFT